MTAPAATAWWLRDADTAYDILLGCVMEIATWGDTRVDDIDEGAYEQVFAIWSGWTDPPHLPKTSSCRLDESSQILRDVAQAYP